MDEIFKALRDPTRRKILQLLRDGSLTAGEIADEFDISKPSISHHLDLLKRADLITVVREGQFLRHHLNTTVVEDLLRWVIDLNSPDHEK
ncbi:autorepressor SdpR family transcription factor [Neolewinella agarilytica]|uniref:Transcriptional regulator, ArsR family n=1 Tax=Neolewinella agarilytica TaxID=478744 RepID=A0A1H9N5G1_9BACT|nr:autorepressor SdpR family transcription factor [Neolewinella agarilytica]SER31128.1 transcriptional regulator, ArsR family [Neolewinella agarilytica]